MLIPIENFVNGTEIDLVKFFQFGKFWPQSFVRKSGDINLEFLECIMGDIQIQKILYMYTGCIKKTEQTLNRSPAL